MDKLVEAAKLDRRAEEIGKAVDLIKPWMNEAPVALAVHQLINTQALLRATVRNMRLTGSL